LIPVPSDRYHHGDLRRTLLDTTAGLVAERGPFAWSLREVARLAGVSHAAPAHHFGDKPGLLRALATEGFELLVDAFAAADDPSAEPEARHHALGRAYMAFGVGHPGHFPVMFRLDLFEPDDGWIIAAGRAYELLVESATRVVTARGDGTSAEDLAITSWCLAHGMVELSRISMLGDLDPDELAERVLRTAEAGLNPHPQPELARARARKPGHSAARTRG
jgi:AcrR family transcriptional regulator